MKRREAIEFVSGIPQSSPQEFIDKEASYLDALPVARLCYWASVFSKPNLSDAYPQFREPEDRLKYEQKNTMLAFRNIVSAAGRDLCGQPKRAQLLLEIELSTLLTHLLYGESDFCFENWGPTNEARAQFASRRGPAVSLVTGTYLPLGLRELELDDSETDAIAAGLHSALIGGDVEFEHKLLELLECEGDSTIENEYSLAVKEYRQNSELLATEGEQENSDEQIVKAQVGSEERPQNHEPFPENDPEPIECFSYETDTTRFKVQQFLIHCNQVSKDRILKNHIWKLVGHTKARQFEFFQAEDKVKATDADRRNFTRVLNMEPAKFVETLRAKHLLRAKQTR